MLDLDAETGFRLWVKRKLGCRPASALSRCLRRHDDQWFGCDDQRTIGMERRSHASPILIQLTQFTP